MLKKIITVFAIACSIAVSADSLTQGKPSDYSGYIRQLGVTPDGKLKINGNGVWTQKNFLDVKDAKQFAIDFEFSQTNGEAVGGIGIICYGKDKKMIGPLEVNRVANSDTVLAEECTFTDSKIIVKNGANWKKGGNYLAAFETKNDFSDLPNRNITRNGIKEVKKLENGNYEITFTNEIGKEYPAGTAVRQHAAGATYNYIFYGKLSNIKKNMKYSVKNLRPGTAYAGFIILVNSAKNFSSELTFKCETVK